MKTLRVIALIVCMSVTLLIKNGFAYQDPDLSTPSVSVLKVEGTIGPTVTSFIIRGIETAIARGDQCLIIELDTPGGLLTSTQDIVREMLASELPLVVYVSPKGAAAGSAGAYITLAAHIAAMAPATTIGAASPVSMAPGGAGMDSVMQKKIFNYSENYIEGIAEERGRNKEWAISAVRDGSALTDYEALEMNVIDIRAVDLRELLTKIHGTEVEGTTLNTKDASINRLQPTFAEKVFSFILRPEIILILTLIAIYGIIGEVTNPGAIIPGVGGVIALVLLLYGTASLPINTAGFILIGLAVILFISEALTPTFGILMAGGAVSFFLGALMLFQDFPEEMQLSWFWLVPATILTVLFFGLVAGAGLKAQFSKHRTGPESMISKLAVVVDPVNSEKGRVLIDGEYWNARTRPPQKLKRNESCEIQEIDGLTLIVKPISKNLENHHGSI